MTSTAEREARRFGVAALEPWRRFFRTRLLVTAISNALLGLLLSTSRLDDLALRPLAGLLGATICVYLFGMGLNDFRDRDRDRTLHPDRPLVTGSVRPAAALAVLLCLLPLALGLATLAGLFALAWCGVLVAFVLLYDLAVKQVGIVGPAAMGAVRAALVILGGVSALPSRPLPQPIVLEGALVVGFYVALLTHYSMEEERARPPSLRVRAGAVLLGLAAALAAFLGARARLDDPAACAGSLPVLAWIGVMAFPLACSTPAAARLVTFRLLLALPLVDAALLAGARRWLPAAACLAYWLWAWRPFRGSRPLL